MQNNPKLNVAVTPWRAIDEWLTVMWKLEKYQSHRGLASKVFGLLNQCLRTGNLIFMTYMTQGMPTTKLFQGMDGNWTHDLWFTRPTPYHLATTPPYHGCSLEIEIWQRWVTCQRTEPSALSKKLLNFFQGCTHKPRGWDIWWTLFVTTLVCIRKLPLCPQMTENLAVKCYKPEETIPPGTSL